MPPLIRLRFASARRAGWKMIYAPASANEMERGSVSRSRFKEQHAKFLSDHVLPGEAAAGHRPALRFVGDDVRSL